MVCNDGALKKVEIVKPITQKSMMRSFTALWFVLLTKNYSH